MGIKHLNKYLQHSCNESINQIHLSELSGKKIVVDTSIYLYRFMGEGALLENFYLMISIFRQYNIIPLFVFDGKPPIEKELLLKQRKLEKKEAQEKYRLLEQSLYSANEEEKVELKENMLNLKRQFIRINHVDIENVKTLIQSYGVSYVEAPGESDKLCAKMVCKNKAYACLSEDMDLFVYGCNRVLRYLSLLNKNVILYDLPSMLREIDMNMTEFQYVCVVSGTDYNTTNNVNTTLSNTLKYFKKFKKSGDDNFYEWLDVNTDYIDNIYVLYNTVQMFSLSNMVEYKNYENIKIVNGPVNLSNLKTIMTKENFLFVD